MKTAKTKAAKPPKKKAKHTGEETVSLRHEFTDKEYRELGGKLTTSLDSITQLEKDLAAISKDYKARIAQMEGVRDELSNKVRNCYEMRQTKVFVIYYPQSGMKTFFALDDKKRKTPIGEEPMRESDYQAELPLPKPAEAKPGDAPPANVVPMTGEAPQDGKPLVSVADAVTDAEREANYKLVRAQAIEVIRSESKASVSLIQRRLKIGYTLATAIIDELERNGGIGPANGTEPRAILALPDPEPTGTAPMDTSNPPPVPAKKKSDKRKPTKAEFQAQQEAKGDGDK